MNDAADGSTTNGNSSPSGMRAVKLPHVLEIVPVDFCLPVSLPEWRYSRTQCHTRPSYAHSSAAKAFWVP